MDITLESLLLSLCSLICSGIISAVVSTVVKRSINKKMDQHLATQDELLLLREEHARATREADREKFMQKALSPIEEKLDKIYTSLDLNTEGTITLLRESMKQARDYYITQGYVSSSDWASWYELYNTYKRLGGNHFAEYVDAWKNDVDQLRNKSKDTIN